MRLAVDNVSTGNYIKHTKLRDFIIGSVGVLPISIAAAVAA